MRAEEVRRPFPVRLIVGVLLALLGTILTLDNLLIIDAYPILRFWSVGLVAIGLAVWMNGNPWGGGAWVGVGLWILAYNLALIHWDLFDLWPLFLVGIGVVLLGQAFRPESRESVEDSSTIQSFTACCTTSRTSRSESFRGGAVTTVVGASRIDLREAEIEGSEAIVDVWVCCGGVEILIPEHWKVTSRINPVMGGFEDKTKPTGDASKTLIIRGLAAMGGVEVSN